MKKKSFIQGGTKMKKKRMLATLLATTMVLGSSMTVFAEEKTTVSGDSSLSGNGDVMDVDTEIYRVVIPTDGAFQFRVDPKGLQGVPEGESVPAEDLAAYAGKITCDSTPTILNRGAVDMQVDVSLKMNTGNNELATSQLKKTKALTQDDTTDANVCLYVAPSLSKVTSLPADDTPFSPEFTPVAGAEGGIVLTESVKKLSFVLPATKYEYKNTNNKYTYEKVGDADKGNGTALAFGGWVNPKADWSDYVPADDSTPATKSISMEALFHFDKKPAGVNFPTTEDAAYGLVTAVTDGVEVELSNGSAGVKEVLEGTLSKAAPENVTYSVTLPSGATGISEVTVPSWGDFALKPAQCTIDNNTITLTGSAFTANDIGDLTMTVKFTGSDSTKTIVLHIVS